MLKIKRDDQVVVIAGKDKGKRGKVLKVGPTGKLLVAGVNMIKKHQKPNPQMNIAGGIIEKEAFIDASNIAIFNAVTNQADRVGFKILEESGKKIRIFKSNGAAVDA